MRPTGVIDFGDLALGWLVGDLAVTCTSVLRRPAHHPLDVLPAVRAYDALLPLRDEELAALWPLVVLRGAVLVAAGEHQLALDPDNPDLVEPMEGEWHVLTSALSLDPDLAEEALRAAVGRPPAPRYDAARAVAASAAPLAPGPTPVVLDLSVTSEHLHGGRFLDAGIEPTLLRAAAASGGGAAVTRWGEGRLTRTVLDTVEAPPTVALGVDLLLPEGTGLVAPVAGRVTVATGNPDEALRLTHPSGLTLLLGGDVTDVHPGDVEAGGPVGRAGSGPVHVQWCVVPDARPPAFAAAVDTAAWRSLCPDPSGVVGADVASHDPDPDDLLRRRRAALAPMQRELLRRADARRARVAPPPRRRGRSRLRRHGQQRRPASATGTRGSPTRSSGSWRTLNTNSRFHYRALVELSRAAGRAARPTPLDTGVPRQQRVRGGRPRAADGAGPHRPAGRRRGRARRTTAGRSLPTPSRPRSTTTRARSAPGPTGCTSRRAPNAYRGRHRGPGAGAGVRRRTSAPTSSTGSPRTGARRPRFICEPVFGNAGGVLLPDGYLAGGVRRASARRGGVCIADEVQVGYGRLGHCFWGFEQSGRRPRRHHRREGDGQRPPARRGDHARARSPRRSRRRARSSPRPGAARSLRSSGSTVLDVHAATRGCRRTPPTSATTSRGGSRALAGAAPDRRRGARDGPLPRRRAGARPRARWSRRRAEARAICERLRDLGVVVQPSGGAARTSSRSSRRCA